MSHSTHTPDDVRSPGTQDVDEALTGYFRAALPASWPACPRTADDAAAVPAPSGRRSGHAQIYRRLAAAAAVAALVVGYTSFGGHISDPDSSLRLEIDTSRTMGMKHLKPGEVLGSQPAKDVMTEPTKATGKKE